MNLQDVQDQKKKTERVLTTIYNLPAMSGIMLEVTRLLNDPSTNTAELSNKIGKDQGLATKILTIANSPLYGLPRKVSTIDFAILLIGFQDIKNIVVALTMVDSFKNKSDRLFKQQSYWLHCVITGTVAKKISDDLGYRIGNEAFTAGLLHELGLPIINKYFPEEFKLIIGDVKENEEVNYKDAELHHLGMSHQNIGKFLAKKWNLPDNISDVIQYHHIPGEAKDNQILISIVHLADYLTQRLRIADYQWDEDYELDESVLEILKFESREKLDEFVDQYASSLESEVKLYKDKF